MASLAPAVEGVAGIGATRIHLKVVPGGSRDRLMGLHGTRLRVKVSAPPEGGKANRAVLSLLAATLGLSPAALRLDRGAASPMKTVLVDGLEPTEVLRRLEGTENT